MGELGALVYLLMICAAVALVIAWILLPIALIGTKPILKDIRHELREIKAIALEANKRARDAEIKAERAAPRVE